MLTTDGQHSYSVAADWVFGREAPHTVSKGETSYVERQNLTMRTAIRRFTRRTNGFSKRFECLAAALSLHFVYYNWCRSHLSIDGRTPAMAAGLDYRARDLPWIVGMIE